MCAVLPSSSRVSGGGSRVLSHTDMLVVGKPVR